MTNLPMLATQTCWQEGPWSVAKFQMNFTEYGIPNIDISYVSSFIYVMPYSGFSKSNSFAYFQKRIQEVKDIINLVQPKWWYRNNCITVYTGLVLELVVDSDHKRTLYSLANYM